MGQKIQLKCDNCDNRELFQTGQGIADSDLDRVLAAYDGASQTAIREALARYDRPLWNHTRMVAMCLVNRSVSVVPVFSITDTADPTAGEAVTADTTDAANTDTVIAIACSCGGDHELYTDDDLESGAKHVKCPRCGHDMTYSVTGYWD